jgi:uncharacterized protein (DUF2147 family)
MMVGSTGGSLAPLADSCGLQSGYRKVRSMFVRRVRVLVLAIVLFSSSVSAADLASPVGRWRTIDDETNTERSIVEIVQVGDELQGRVVQLLNPQPSEPKDPVCEKCEGALKNQRVIGMTFLWGLKASGDEWTGGAILDPKTGKIYNARLKLIDGGRKLEVRGYIGTPLLGRTQTWLRQQ